MEMVRYKSIALALSATALTLGAWLYQPCHADRLSISVCCTGRFNGLVGL
jgi:hypothetical protein